MLRSFVMAALIEVWPCSFALCLTSEEIVAKLRAADPGGAGRKDQDLQGRQRRSRALGGHRQDRPHRRRGEIARRADEARRLYWIACRLASHLHIDDAKRAMTFVNVAKVPDRAEFRRDGEVV